MKTLIHAGRAGCISASPEERCSIRRPLVMALAMSAILTTGTSADPYVRITRLDFSKAPGECKADEEVTARGTVEYYYLKGFVPGFGIGGTRVAHTVGFYLDTLQTPSDEWPELPDLRSATGVYLKGRQEPLVPCTAPNLHRVWSHDIGSPSRKDQQENPMERGQTDFTFTFRVPSSAAFRLRAELGHVVGWNWMVAWYFRDFRYFSGPGMKEDAFRLNCELKGYNPEGGMALVPKNASQILLEGCVRDSLTRKAKAGAAVTACWMSAANAASGSAQVLGSGTSDAQGWYSFSVNTGRQGNPVRDYHDFNLSPLEVTGTFIRVAAEAPGCRSETESFYAETPPSTIEITGNVRDTKGQAITNAKVTISGRGNPVSASVDNTGAYKVQGMDKGTQPFSKACDFILQRMGAGMKVTLEPEFFVNLGDEVKVKVELSDIEDQPLENAAVTLDPTKPEDRLLEQRTDSEGVTSFTVTHFDGAVTNYTFLVEAPGKCETIEIPVKAPGSLIVRDMKVIQAIDGTRCYVAGRDTGVRAWLEWDHPTISNIEVEVRLFVDDKPVIQKKASVKRWLDYLDLPEERLNAEDSVNLVAPKTCLPAGGHIFRVEAYPVDSNLDSNRTDNVMQKDGSFAAVVKPVILFFSIDPRVRTDQRIFTKVSEQDEVSKFISLARPHLKDVFPVSDVECRNAGALPFIWNVGWGDSLEGILGDSADLTIQGLMGNFYAARLLSTLMAYNALHSIDGKSGADFVVGLYPRGAYGTGRYGSSYRLAAGKRAVLVDVMTPATLSHEIGHFYKFGEEYDRSAGTEGIQVSGTGYNTFLDKFRVFDRPPGYNPVAPRSRLWKTRAQTPVQDPWKRVINDVAYNFMGNGGLHYTGAVALGIPESYATANVWVNCKTWDNLFSWMVTGEPLMMQSAAQVPVVPPGGILASPPASSFVSAASSGNAGGKTGSGCVLLVQGMRLPDGRVVLDPPVSVRGGKELAAQGTSPVRVSVTTGDGNAVSANAVVLSGSSGPSAAFIAALRYDPEKAPPKQLAVTWDAKTVARMSASPSSPKVMSAPSYSKNTGEVSWEATDPDGDKLVYTLCVVPEKGPALPLAVGIATNRFVPDWSCVPGGKQCRLRLEASDGFLSATADSEEFALPDHPPRVVITGGENFLTRDVTLSGWASDPETGTLPGDVLVWRDSEGKEIGRGERLSVRLPVGPCAISLEATDPLGQKTRKEVQLQVTEEDLLACWDFTRKPSGSNVVEDLSGNGLTAGIRGGRWTGMHGIFLDGQDQYIAVSNSPLLHSDSELTIVADVTPSSLKPWNALVWKGNEPDGPQGCENREYSLFLQQQGGLLLCSTPSNMAGNSALSISSQAGFSSGRSLVVGVVSCAERTAKIYVNGKLGAQNSYPSAAIRKTSGPLTIGAVPGPALSVMSFTGWIRSVRLYGRALSEIEVKSLTDELSAMPTRPLTSASVYDPDEVVVRGAWGSVQRIGTSPAFVKVDKKTMEKDLAVEDGLFTCPGAEGRTEVVYHHDGSAAVLSGHVVVLDNIGYQAARGTCAFMIKTDRRIRWQSGRVLQATPAVPFSVDLKGVRMLRLITTDAGDGVTEDWAAWLNLLVDKKQGGVLR